MSRKTVSFKPAAAPERSENSPAAVKATAEEWVEAAPLADPGRAMAERGRPTLPARLPALHATHAGSGSVVGVQDFSQAWVNAGWRMVGKHLVDLGDLLACRTPLDVCQWQSRLVRDSLQIQLGLGSNVARLLARVLDEAEATLASRRVPGISSIR